MPDTSSAEPGPARRGSGRASIARQSEPQPLNFNVKAIPLQLFAAAQNEAKYALRHYASLDREEKRRTAIASGAAVEYLLRCALAVEDPALLASNQAESIVAMSRARRHKAFDVTSLKSITTSEVIDRLYLIHPSVNIRDRALKLLNLRNTAIHMALVPERQTRDSVRQLVGLLDHVLDLIEADPEHFWGRGSTTLLETIRSEAATELAERVAYKVTNAQQKFKELVRGVAQDARPGLLAALVAARRPWDESDQETHGEKASCVVCGSQGDVIYQMDIGDPQENAAGIWEADVTYTVMRFICPVCGLDLDADELPDSGLRYEELEPTTAKFAYGPIDDWVEPEMFSQWPDEDDERGR